MSIISHFLERQVAVYPHRRAVISKTGVYSFSELDSVSNQIAQWLLVHSISRGGRILLLSTNSIELVATIFGVLKVACAFVPVHPNITVAKLAYILSNCQPEVIIADASLYERHLKLLEQQKLPILILPGSESAVSTLTQNTGNPLVEYWAVLANYPTEPSGIQVKENDLAAILYTSGSTKDPKGVMSLHRQVTFVTCAINAQLQNSAADVVLCGLPLSFDYGLYQVFLCAEAGATLVIEPDFGFPTTIPKLLTMHRVTGLPGVPSLFALLLRSRILERIKLPYLRYITSTGDIFPPAHIDRLREILPHISVFSMYGLTECKRVSILAPEQLDTYRGSVGLPLQETQISVIDDIGIERASGVGQLVVRGPHIMEGYWNDSIETARRFKFDSHTGERTLWTGDRCRINSDGYLYFLGRDEMLIKRRGYRISVAEVESFLCDLDGIVEAGVIGMPDALEGEQIWAFVSTLPNIQVSLDHIEKQCMATLTAEAWPQRFIITQLPLPKTPHGKIDRLALRRLARVNSEQDITENLQGR